MSLPAHIAFEQRQYTTALSLYKKELEKTPNPSTMYNMGLCYMQLENWKEAMEIFSNVLRLDPLHTLAQNNLGIALQKMGQLFQSEKMFRELLRDDPWNIDIAINLAGVLLEQGRPDVGIDILAPIQRHVHFHPTGWDMLGSCFLDAGDIAMGFACFHRAYEQAPLDSLILLHLLTVAHDYVSKDHIDQLLHYGRTQHPDNIAFILIEYCIKQHVAYTNNLPYTSPPPDTLPTFLQTSTTYLFSALQKQRIQYPLVKCHIYTTVYGSLAYACSIAQTDGLVLEFGVRFGTSLQMLQQLSNDHVYGFDSFQGLPTDWHEISKGSYSTAGIIPDLGANTTLYPGLFVESIDIFLMEHPDNIKLIHVDCDLYQSTMDIFDRIHPRLQQGTIIVFNEYLLYPHWQEDEWKAWQEIATTYAITYTYRGFSLVSKQAIIQIESIG